jgi:hypothetical protein
MITRKLAERYERGTNAPAVWYERGTSVVRAWYELTSIAVRGVKGFTGGGHD